MDIVKQNADDVNGVSTTLESERTPGSAGGASVVAVSGTTDKGTGQLSRSHVPSQICPEYLQTNSGLGGGGRSSYSLDTCYQVGIFDTSEEIREKERQWRYRLADSLEQAGRMDDSTAVRRCGEDFKVGKCPDCGAEPAFPLSCENRLCPNCAKRRSAILIKEHQDILKQIRYPKFVTLTFESVETITKEYLAWMRKCFTKLRHRQVWQSVWGGIYAFEFTYTPGVGWHPHIHTLIASSYIDQEELSREWWQITGNSFVVDIRALQYGFSKWDAIREVVKYPTKISTFIEYPELVNEFLNATAGINLVYGFGALYRIKTAKHGNGKVICPLCGGTNVDFRGSFGFTVPELCVQRVKHGWLWRSNGGVS